MPRHRDGYPAVFLKTYAATLKRVRTALAQPIQYAGPGRWSVFAKPAALGALEGVAAVPGASAGDVCVVVPADLWQAFRDVSLWVEALCIHEWSLFTERIAETATRRAAYTLLTARPHHRLPLHWERNQVDLLLAEGVRLTCPWTGRPLGTRGYDLHCVFTEVARVQSGDLEWATAPNSHVVKAYFGRLRSSLARSGFGVVWNSATLLAARRPT